MPFNAKEYRRIYREVHECGRIIKDKTSPDSREDIKIVKDHIESLLKKASDLLDEAKLFPKPPLWKYNVNNVQTWESHGDFAYSHLFKPIKMNVKLLV